MEIVLHLEDGVCLLFPRVSHVLRPFSQRQFALFLCSVSQLGWICISLSPPNFSD